MTKRTNKPVGDQPQIESGSVEQRLDAMQKSIASLEDSLRSTPMNVKVQLLKSGEGEGDKEQNDSGSIAGIVKDEIILLGSLIFFVGIISTDSYYNKFGITYQFLDLPTFHIIYRGLTMPLNSPELFLPYLLAVLWLVVDNTGARRKWKWLLDFRGVLVYVLIVLLIAIAYPLSKRAGIRLAEIDLSEDTSTLPKINHLQLKSKTEWPPILLPGATPGGGEGAEAGKGVDVQTPAEGDAKTATPESGDEATVANTDKAGAPSKTSGKEIYTYGDQYRLLVIDSDFVVLFKPLTAEQVKNQNTAVLSNIKRFPKGEIDDLETIRVR